jgi:glycosyltransferase involved in cell wall biosynthesis
VKTGNRPRPAILVVSFFPAFNPPRSGGEMRLLYLYQELSNFYDITLISSTDFGARFEEVYHTPSFRELRFPKDEYWRAAYAALEAADMAGDLSGLAFALAVSNRGCRLRATAEILSRDADIVVHEFPYSVPIFQDVDLPFEIYNSHNFEASLIPSVVRGAGQHRGFLRVLQLERTLVERCRLVCATSIADAEKFRLLYGANPDRIRLCPNGFNETGILPLVAARCGWEPPIGNRPRVLFTGSAHPPNVDGAEFLISLAGALTHCDIVLAGGVCNSITQRSLPPNVEVIGAFNEAQKIQLLATADVYLNPVVLGSGTSLKAIEALAVGIPMVTTAEGARGLPVS